MIVCLAFMHTSIFNKPFQVFFKLNQHMQSFLCVICKFLPVIIFGNFLFGSSFFNWDSLHARQNSHYKA